MRRYRRYRRYRPLRGVSDPPLYPPVNTGNAVTVGVAGTELHLAGERRTAMPRAETRQRLLEMRADLLAGMNRQVDAGNSRCWLASTVPCP